MKTCSLILLLALSLLAWPAKPGWLAAPAAWASAPKSVVTKLILTRDVMVCPESDVISSESTPALARTSVVVCPEPDVISLKPLAPALASAPRSVLVLPRGQAPDLVDQVIKALGTKAGPEERQKLLDTIDRALAKAREAIERGDRSKETLKLGMDAVVARALLLDDKAEIKRVNDILDRMLRNLGACAKAKNQTKARHQERWGPR